MSKTFYKVGLIISLSSLLLLYQNCSSGETTKGVTNNQSLEFCGEEGFAFIHKNYFQPQCGTCHDTGGFAFPAFADNNLLSSYSWARTLASDNLLETSLDNKFCGPTCNLEEGSEVHQALVQWLTCK